MKKLLYLLLFFSTTAFAWHKYYVSVTEIDIKDDHLEIIMRTFPDDIENVLHDLYGIKADLSQKTTQKFLEDYIKTHFLIYDGQNQPITYQFVGTTLQDNFLVILLQAPIPPNLKELQVKNTILFDMFDEQKNIVHFIKGTQKSSYILIKKDPVAVFELP